MLLHVCGWCMGSFFLMILIFVSALDMKVNIFCLFFIFCLMSFLVFRLFVYFCHVLYTYSFTLLSPGCVLYVPMISSYHDFIVLYLLQTMIYFHCVCQFCLLTWSCRNPWQWESWCTSTRCNNIHHHPVLPPQSYLLLPVCHCLSSSLPLLSENCGAHCIVNINASSLLANH